MPDTKKPKKPTIKPVLAPKSKWAKARNGSIPLQRRTKESADAIREYRRNRYRNDKEFAEKSRVSSKLRQRKVWRGEIPKRVARPFKEEGRLYYKLSYIMLTTGVTKSRFNIDCKNGVIPKHTYPLISRAYNENQYKLIKHYYSRTNSFDRELSLKKLHKNWNRGDYNDGTH